MRPRRAVLTLTALAAWSCAPETSEAPPVDRLLRADTVAMARAAFDPAAFDTLVWESPDAATSRGRLVFRISCAKCHGEEGAGDGGFVMNGDTLRPPSFLPAEWRFAEDPVGLRRQIFTGTVAGMPYWGLVGLKYRDIDAVARFIGQELRSGSGGG